MYEIDQERDNKLLKIRMSGFWSAQLMAAFERDMDVFVRGLGPAPSG